MFGVTFSLLISEQRGGVSRWGRGVKTAKKLTLFSRTTLGGVFGYNCKNRNNWENRTNTVATRPREDRPGQKWAKTEFSFSSFHFLPPPA